MGVYGLWRLLDKTGKQVPLETLEGKVLAIDISIWIHQVLQGYQDRFGNPKPNAHLIGLFYRICKLLYYRIKPVFVFDGGVPMLKKNTIALRRKQKSMAKNKAQQMRTELINNLIKHSAVKTVLNPEKQDSGSSEIILSLPNQDPEDDIFKLPDEPSTSKTQLSLSDDYDSDSSVELSPRKQTKWIGNIHNVDVSSAEFKALPADMRYEILTDLKETRKQNSWGRLHEMPEESHEFSGFQMKRLLKRRLVQESLESAEKEMGGKTLTLDELDKLLKEQGINTNGQNCTYRVASDSTTRLLYISDKSAYFKNNSNDIANDGSDTSDSEKIDTEVHTNDTDKIDASNADKIDETVASSSKTISICDDINEYELSDEWDNDIEVTMGASSNTESEVELNESRPLPKKYFGKNFANPALTYMLEYSGLPEEQILNLLEQNKQDNQKACKNLFKTEDHEKKDNLLNILTSETENNEESAKSDSTEVIKSINKQSTELFKLSTVTNTNLSSNVSNVSEVKSTEVTTASSTDSDTDDFIEIEDVPMPDIINNKNVSQGGIQITFKSDEKIENDIFADVFEGPNSESKPEINSQDTLLSNKIPTETAEKLPGVDETLGNEITLTKPDLKPAEDQVKDKQLPDVTKVNDLEIQIIQSDGEKVNVPLEKNEVEETNNMEHVRESEKSNTPVTDTRDNADEHTSNVIERISPTPMTEDELLSLKGRLEDEQTELMANIGKLERQGIDISDRIRTEAQELLRLFGIPYIVAPMEAEAQCAYLEQIHLTDGTITDDSDIWLFGGQCVYKNFFNNNKKVLQFCLGDIEHHFKLTRNEMIQLALLVGSDYTVGLTGIGPVTALEILAAFPSQGDNLLQGLADFCSWVETGKVAAPGKAGLRTKLQNLKVHKGFPSQAVVQAYLFPKVDESKEGFTWGKPNMMLLYDYTKKKFAWDKNKFNAVMTPVQKRLEENKTQKLIDMYFKLQTVPQSIEMTLSKRVQKAVQKLNNDNAENSETTEDGQSQPPKRKLKSFNESQKKKRAPRSEQCDDDSTQPKVSNVVTINDKSINDYIPQREKDKANALKKKLHAIEVLRKSKQGLCKTKKVKSCVRKVKKEAELSESDSNSS
ncbi:rad2 superfamily protein mus201 [Megachile rotundata]|uniref:rad2 superfamily protein mus201 n=1 Tax=Megachile rotundata TaxID=143995 RepID=UPI000615000A|nr:PREDICTED: DNA repair protein complementing XP-G cells homolog [Megachile rotundata]